MTDPVAPVPDTVLIVPKRRLDRLTRRAGAALLLAVASLVGSLLAIGLVFLYLDSRATLRDQQARQVQEQIDQSNYNAKVSTCAALKLLVDDPLAKRAYDQFGCDSLPPIGMDPDGGGPLVPAPNLPNRSPETTP